VTASCDHHEEKATCACRTDHGASLFSGDIVCECTKTARVKQRLFHILRAKAMLLDVRAAVYRVAVV
jgi:hypothetical protein